jgi:hypothetical protein
LDPQARLATSPGGLLRFALLRFPRIINSTHHQLSCKVRRDWVITGGTGPQRRDGLPA